MRTKDESIVWLKAYEKALRKGYDPAGWARFAADMAVKRFVTRQKKRRAKSKPTEAKP